MYSTTNWLIGILVGSWVATFVVGFLHGAHVLSEPVNPLMHVFRDWFIVIVFTVPISWLLTKTISNKQI